MFDEHGNDNGNDNGNGIRISSRRRRQRSRKKSIRQQKSREQTEYDHVQCHDVSFHNRNESIASTLSYASPIPTAIDNHNTTSLSDPVYSSSSSSFDAAHAAASATSAACSSHSIFDLSPRAHLCQLQNQSEIISNEDKYHNQDPDSRLERYPNSSPEPAVAISNNMNKQHYDYDNKVNQFYLTQRVEEFNKLPHLLITEQELNACIVSNCAYCLFYLFVCVPIRSLDDTVC